jgi:hypothetical protein
MRPYVLRDKNQADEITSNRLSLMQGKEDQFKQLPMLLPKETNLPSVENSAEPLMTPQLPANTINTKPAVTRPSISGASGNTPASPANNSSAN